MGVQRVLQRVGKKISHSFYGAKHQVQKQLRGKNPFRPKAQREFAKRRLEREKQLMKTASVQKGAVENIQALQSKHQAAQKVQQGATVQKLQGPLRAPPPPPKKAPTVPKKPVYLSAPKIPKL